MVPAATIPILLTEERFFDSLSLRQRDGTRYHNGNDYALSLSGIAFENINVVRR